MALRLSSGLRTKLLGTSSLYDLLNNGVIDIYTGSQPASADYTESGTKLVTISSTSGTNVADGVKLGTAATGVLDEAATPVWTGVVSAAGVAGWFRWRGSSGTGGHSGTSSTAVRLDGAVGVSGAELNLSHTTLAVSATVTVTSVTITQPSE